MSNTYFRFKQFTVNQEHCAMKVCTDACILGASANAFDAASLLDIGTGTGLLSLMLAQRYPLLQIEAIEINVAAAKQAEDNFNKSPWHTNLVITTGDIKSFPTVKKYDHIICNPPFYENHLKPENKANTVARHDEQLTIEELATVVSQLLAHHGKFTVLLPPDGMKQLEKELLSKKIFLNKKLFIKDRTELPVIRMVGEFSFNALATSTQSLVIKKDVQNYTDGFKLLMSHFYLAF